MINGDNALMIFRHQRKIIVHLKIKDIATVFEGGKVKLAWQAVADASSYQIYRQASGGSLQPLMRTAGIEYIGFESADVQVVRLRHGPGGLPKTRIAVCNIRCLPDVFYESRLGIVRGLNHFFWVFENSDGGIAYIGRSDYNLRGEMR
jgi:hypothetical protein